MTTPLTNQLGTGAIPADEEHWLLSLGMKFAAYVDTPGVPRFMVISKHENIQKRWAEQMQTLYDEEHGLPVQYRIPVSA